ncbi:sensor histidine kinase [Cohnella thailandensis]|uniref:histidine kinase n=1 Tax=Cohnella thailandensis TaxID=557557 RepID=A0A841T695_9BACL|nr:sensor histidine kinase [Cohnella thailandensis]MBB6637828.1 sensor histidine kinase [Cohnella thailandensis]MBP1973992.1 two-component system sensor histidine kinase YesM [Cohnella thailandensis]
MISRLRERLKLRNTRLSSKLIMTYLLLTVIPMSLLGYVTYTQFTRSIEEQIGEYMPRFLNQANSNIEQRLMELASLPDLLFNSDDMIAILRRDEEQSVSDRNKDLFSLNSYMSRTYLGGSNPDVLAVFLLSKNRFFQSSKVAYTGFDRDQAIAPYRYELSNLVEKPKIILPSETGLRFQNDVPYILIMKQIADTDNRRILGTMFIAVQLTFIDRILHDFEKNDKADLWVMNGKGERLYHTDPEMIGTFDAEIDRYPIRNGSFRTTGAGPQRLVSVTESAELGWVFVHSIPLKYLTEKTDLVRNVTVFAFIGVVLVTAILAVVLSLNITRPLKKLSRLMKNAEMGHFQVDHSLQSRDEVGSLARSFNSMITTTRELIQTNYRIEIRQKEAELYALQSQINPHFIYNTLETIGMAVEERETETVVDMVTLLGRMLRFSVGNKAKSVPLTDEVQHIRDYLTIQKYRFEDRLTFDIQLGTDIERENLYSPKFILQPIVENAIKHGLETRKVLDIQIGIGKEMSFRSGKQDVVYRIRDNGPGIPAERMAELEEALRSDTHIDKDSGFGLSNVNARIVLMHGPEYGIQLHSIYGKGTEVIVRIPALNGMEGLAESEGMDKSRGEEE